MTVSRRFLGSVLAGLLLILAVALPFAQPARAAPANGPGGPLVAQQASPTPTATAPNAPTPSAPAATPAAPFSVGVPGQTNPNQSALVHDTLTFDAGASQGANLSYSWDFGDGSPPASGRQVTHSYTQVDDYTAKLTVAGAGGGTTTSSQTVRITPRVVSLVGQPDMGQVVPSGSVSVNVNIQAPGPGSVTASLSGNLLSSKPVDFSTGDDVEFVTLNGTVADETNPTIDQQVIRTAGGSIPLQGNVGLELTYKNSAGTTVDLNYASSLLKNQDASQGVWSITYPNYSIVTGLPAGSDLEQQNFYINGDPGFHHPDDQLVREYAFDAARAGGALPSDPGQAMQNLYHYVRGLFSPDNPAQLEPDTTIVQKIASGELVPGKQAEKYVCVSEIYFLTSLARTIGLPSRELTVGLAKPVSQDATSGAWQVTWVQEGAAQIWFGGTWNFYDTWLGVPTLGDYLGGYYAYQAWYSYSPQHYELKAQNGDPLGLFGHDFSIGEIQGIPGSGDEWNLLDRQERSGIVVTGFPPS